MSGRRFIPAATCGNKKTATPDKHSASPKFTRRKSKMRHTAAFLGLLGCLAGGAAGATRQSAPQQQEQTVRKTEPQRRQPCAEVTMPAPEGDWAAPQNRIEYGGGG